MSGASRGHLVSSLLLSEAGKRGRLERLARAAAVGLLVAALAPREAQAVEVPVISAGLGPCTADFTVKDNSAQPLYNAKIQVTIVYGFMNKRKQDLEIGTNSEGKARFEGLPDKLKKKPLEFHVHSGAQTKSVMQDPEVNCHASFSVVLTTQ